jgi:hypothetical protein
MELSRVSVHFKAAYWDYLETNKLPQLKDSYKMDR